MNSFKSPMGSNSFLPIWLGSILVLIWAFLLTAGCVSVPSHYVPVMPAPVRSFPPVKAGLVRLPVEITFSSGGEVVQHVFNYFAGGPKKMLPEMPGLNLKTHLEDFWGKMQAPIYLDKNMWLLIQPETFGIGTMRTDLKRFTTIHTVLEMTAKPEILFGPRPVMTPRPMPALHAFRPGPGTFQAMTNTRITYEEANEYFRDPRLKLIGMVLPGTGERKVTLEGLRFYGSGGKVIAEVKLHYNPPIINFTGKPAKLTVYLRGTPRYLPKERVFDLPDLDYDIKSNDLLVQIADFLFKSDFKNDLRKIARLPIGIKTDVVKAKIVKALNHEFGRFTRLHAQVNDFKVLDGFADNEGIQMRLAIQGTATLEVVWN